MAVNLDLPTNDGDSGQWGNKLNTALTAIQNDHNALETTVGTKADSSELSNYAPLADAPLTGTPTINGSDAATIDDVTALSIALGGM